MQKCGNSDSQKQKQHSLKRGPTGIIHQEAEVQKRLKQ
jgi:hypothetical protein